MQEQARQNTILVIATALGWLAWAVYALSPIDLVPDFIPIIGWIDDTFGLGALVSLTWYTVRHLGETGELMARRHEHLDYEPVAATELRRW